MILGVGVDIIEIQRIQEVINRSERFLEKFFTTAEIDYFQSRNMNAEHVAGSFAAKEAVAKALGTGFRGFSLKDIEVLRNDLGKPEVLLNKGAKALVKDLGDINIHLSISHNRENAIAYAVLEVI